MDNYMNVHRRVAAGAFNVLLTVIVTVLSCAAFAQVGNEEAESRAEYWAQRGYTFDARFMSASMMDNKVKDIDRAKYWADKGYTFDPNFLNASMMDSKVKDIDRAKYWADRGYTFDPNFLNASMMDSKVKDIDRAKYWADRGYAFDPNFLNASMMDSLAARGREASGIEKGPISAIAPTTISSDPTDRTGKASIDHQFPRQESKPSPSSQEYILALQTALHVLGYEPGPLDGLPGPRTTSAVRDFQRDCNLTSDGVVGVETRTSLSERLSGTTVEFVIPRDSSQYIPWQEKSQLAGFIRDYKGRIVPQIAENGSFYGEISENTGRPKVVHVGGYYRKDGTYVRGHYRSRPSY